MASKKSRRPRSSAAAPLNSPPPTFDRRLMERQLNAVSRLLADQQFDTLEEANAYLQRVTAGGEAPVPDPTTPLERAQELVYQALETTGEERLRLARRALDLSPDCVEAFNVIAEQTDDAEEARRLYEQGVRAGERVLGPEIFQREKGNFWGMVETRPYMRAREGLAEVLWHLGRRQEAIAHLRALLELNPGDNQGVRYRLANWLLMVGDDAALDTLLAQFPDEGTAAWAYTRALRAFRRDGEGPAADQALQDAFAANRFVPLYMAGLVEPPEEMPAYYGLGDESEALTYVVDAAEAWLATPGALDWFIGVFVQELAALDAPPRRRSKPRRRRR